MKSLETSVALDLPEAAPAPSRPAAAKPIERKVAAAPVVVHAPKSRMPAAGTATVHDAGCSVWWFDARGIDDVEILREVESGNCTHLLLGKEQLERVRTRKRRVV